MLKIGSFSIYIVFINDSYVCIVEECVGEKCSWLFLW